MTHKEDPLHEQLLDPTRVNLTLHSLRSVLALVVVTGSLLVGMCGAIGDGWPTGDINALKGNSFGTNELWCQYLCLISQCAIGLHMINEACTRASRQTF